jgi:hypothetical protein
MKFIIVGMHSSGKQEVIDILEELDVKCGKVFSDVEVPTDTLYNSYNYEMYTKNDINSIFENNAYIFLHEVPTENMSFKAYKNYEGLSLHSFDQNDVFALSPDQFTNIIQRIIKEPVCIVWMDNTKGNRVNRYKNEKRSYDFSFRDNIEKLDMNAFVKYIYNYNHILYFTNEEPARVATIIYTLVKHPELIKLYCKNFN